MVFGMLIAYLLVITHALAAGLPPPAVAAPAPPAARAPIAPAPAAEEFTLDKYQFYWKVFKRENVTLELCKVRTVMMRWADIYVCLAYIKNGKREGILSPTPQDAEAIGAVLARTDEFWNAMKGSPREVIRAVTADRYVVRFVYSPAGGFSVLINKADKRVTLNTVILDRDTAKALVPYLQKARKMAAFLDQKIAPSSSAAAPAPAAEKFTFDNYYLLWELFWGEKTSCLEAEKTQDATFFRLVGENCCTAPCVIMSISPKDAEAIGAVLARTDEFWNAMKGSAQPINRDVPVAHYVVTFSSSPTYGFNVFISTNDKTSLDDKIMLDRNEAKALAPYMQKARKMAEFLDRKIRP